MSAARAARPRRLVNRLVLVTVVAGVGAGVVGALLLHRAESSRAYEDARARNRVMAEQYVVRVDNRIDNLLNELRLIATHQPVTSVDAAAESELRVALRVAPRFDELVLHDVDGVPVAAAATRFLADVADSPRLPGELFTAVEEELIEIVTSPTPKVRLAVPVESPPGRIVGTLLGLAPIDVVAPIEAASVGAAPVPFLVGHDGTVLAHPDRSRTLVDDVVPIDDILAATDRTQVVEREGTRQLISLAESARAPVFAAVQQPESIARDPTGGDLRTLIVILATVMLAVIVAVIVTGEVLLRPLRPLTDVVTRVGRGERHVRADTGGYAEIGQLAREVDRMAAALDQRADQVAELRDLSLLVGSLSERSEVARRIASGAAKLLPVTGAALASPQDAAAMAVEASEGTLAEPETTEEISAGALRTRRAFTRSVADPAPLELLAVPLIGTDGEPLAALVVQRAGQPFDDDEIGLLTAFAAYAAVAVDNARRLQAHRALADELQQAVDRRRDLIGTITHEFRTPLVCIEGFSTALLDGWDRFDGEQRRDFVGRIAHHTAELSDLVTKFLDFAISERGSMEAQIGPTALDAVVEQTVAGLAPLLEDRRLHVDVPPVVVNADPALVRRMLTNLLSNAVKFSTSGSLVTLRASAAGTRVRLEVIDEGIGMTRDEAARAFEPFWRGGAAGARSTRGAGLGLALVNEYVRVMGGVCGVTSQKDHGSNFYVVLPLASPPGVDVRGQEPT